MDSASKFTNVAYIKTYTFGGIVSVANSVWTMAGVWQMFMCSFTKIPITLFKDLWACESMTWLGLKVNQYVNLSKNRHAFILKNITQWDSLEGI